LHGSWISVIRGHDAEWDVESLLFSLTQVLHSSLLASESILGVVFKVAVVLFDGANWKTNLDA
jgi:hypothetical protein